MYSFLAITINQWRVHFTSLLKLHFRKYIHLELTKRFSRDYHNKAKANL